MTTQKKTAVDRAPGVEAENVPASTVATADPARYTARALVDIEFEGPNGIAIIRKGRRFSSDSIPFDPARMEMV